MATVPPDSRLLHAVQSTFTRMQWAYRTVATHGVIEADFDLHHTRTRLHVQTFPPIHAISVVAQASHHIPETRIGLINETLMRTNRELTIGNFELDCDAGQILFRATNIFPATGSHEDIIASLVHSALAEMDRLTPFLTLLLRMEAPELATLNLKLFLQRQDLLPPVPEETEQTP